MLTQLMFVLALWAGQQQTVAQPYAIEFKEHRLRFAPRTTHPSLDMRVEEVELLTDTSGQTIADFIADRARLTFGPDPALGITSETSFTLSLQLRTQHAGFSTIAMCREGGNVHYSLVLGRQPGHLSGELWSWTADRAPSTTRVDDGSWHFIDLAYHAPSRHMALYVDNQMQSIVKIRNSFAGSPAPRLRFGNNLDPNVHQPFQGMIRGVRLSNEIPSSLEMHLEILEQGRVLSEQQVDNGLERWLDLQREPRRPEANSKDDWKRQAAKFQFAVQDALGLWPPPYAKNEIKTKIATDFKTFIPELALETRQGGHLQRQGYEVVRLYWQTFEGYFASGYLYRPVAAARTGKKYPAVLSPHGHWRDGARHSVVQARCLTLARLGYVVLAVDSIHIYDDRIGLSPLGAMTWNNLRGLQLLRELPYVDRDKIGCTGASGGGQQTYYLTGLRTGIQVAVPAVMACHFEEILHSDHVHCACNHIPHMLQAVDMPQIAASFAPKPQLFLSVTGDWTKHFPQHGFPPIQDIYTHFGAEDQVRSMQWDIGHDYNRDMRNQMYAFFARWLKGEARPDEQLEPLKLDIEDLATLNALNLANVPQDPEAIRREFHNRLTFREEARLKSYFLRTYAHSQRPAMRKGEAFRWSEYAVRKWLFPVEEGIDLPVWCIRPQENPDGDVIVIAEGGKAGVLQNHTDWVRALLAKNWNVYCVDIRYTGEMNRGSGWRDLYGRFLGLDEGFLAVRDLLASVAHVNQLKAEGSPLTAVVGLGHHGATAMWAAGLTTDVDIVVIPDLGPLYAEAARRPALSRILLYGDLNHLNPGATSLFLGGCKEPSEFEFSPDEPATIDKPHRGRVQAEPLQPAVLDRI